MIEGGSGGENKWEVWKGVNVSWKWGLCERCLLIYGRPHFVQFGGF